MGQEDEEGLYEHGAFIKDGNVKYDKEKEFYA